MRSTVYNRDGTLVVSGLRAGKSEEQNDENRLGEENGDSNSVLRNMGRMSDF